jgi:hypothetical protein
MTAGDSVELLFKARTEGQADIDKLAKSVAGVSTAAAASVTDVTGLERSIQALTSAVTGNTNALLALEGGFNSASAGAQRTGTAIQGMTGNVLQARSAVQALNGSFNTMGAGRWLASIQGIGPALAGAFSIIGPLSMLAVLGHIAGRFFDVSEAQKASSDELDRQSKKYDEILGKVKRLKDEEYERAHGRGAGQLREGYEAQFTAGSTDHQDIAMLEKQIDVLRQMAHPFVSGRTFTPNADQAFIANLTGAFNSSHLFGLYNNNVQPGKFDAGSVDIAKQALPGLEARLRTARAQQELDTATGNKDTASYSEDARKKADEAAKKRKQELDQITRQSAEYLRSAQGFELTGLQKINAEYDAKIDKLKEEAAQLGKLSPAEQGRLNGAVGKTNEARNLELTRQLARYQDQNRADIGKYLDDQMAGIWGDPRYDGRVMREGLHSENEDLTKGINSNLKVLGYDADASASGVRRRLNASVRGNALAAQSGKMTPQGAADSDYAQRLAAAKQIFQIEKDYANLFDTEEAKQDKLAEARKKYAEEVYQAEAQYEEQLQQLREKDLAKYQNMADSLFDAIHSRTTNLWARNFATGQVKQVFSNVAAPVLQQAGHMLGSIVPSGSPLAQLFHGTVFDPANKGVDVQKQTADNTKNTADQVKGLRDDMRAMSGAPPSAGAGSGSSADLINLPFNHPGLNIPGLSTFGSDVAGIFGSGSGVPNIAGASALFNAGNGSTVSQFMSGLGGGGSNPLGAIFSGLSTNGSTATQLTGVQQAGVAVGTAAMLVGAGMSAVKGFQQGGVGGVSKGISSITGAAAMLDPEPISKAILGGIAAVSGFIGAEFGTGPAQRAKQLTNEISKNQYLAPTALNVTQGMNGTYEDFDSRGNIRTSTLSALPTVAEPYITSRVVNGQRTYYDAPGNVTAPFTLPGSSSGAAPISNVTYNISALDPQSFHDYVRSPANARAIGEATADHLEQHDGRLSNAVRFLHG